MQKRSTKKIWVEKRYTPKWTGIWSERRCVVVKNEKWTEDLYLFRMKPAPPKKDDLQEYIALYCPEKDEKYLNSFFIITSQG